jgi:diacylglycerol O-acyltransferase
LAVTTRALWDLATSPAQAVRALVGAVATPRRLLRSAVDSATGALTLSEAVLPVHGSSLTGQLRGSRRYAWTDVAMADVKAVKKRYDVTVNDVALAAVTGGFRALLLSRHEAADAHMLRSLVPVSTRAPGQESIPDNRVSLLLPYLPVDLADPEERLVAVKDRVRALMRRHEPEAGGSITTIAEYGPFPPVSWAVRLGFRVPQRQIATVTTNVPGPRTTLYALGREAQEMLPYVPIADRVRIGIAMFSYRDVLTFGVTADYDSTPDIEVLTEGITAAMAELVG